MNTPDKKETRGEELERLCKENNLSMAEVLRDAGVSSVTINNWKKKDPNTFKMYDAMKASIDRLSKTA